MARKKGKVFISYSHQDAPTVHTLVRLLRVGGVKVFIDIDSMDYGDDWEVALKNAIRAADRFIIFWSKSAAASTNVRNEYEIAMATDSLTIIPVFLDTSPLPEGLRRFNGLTDLPQVLREAKYSQIIKDPISKRIKDDIGDVMTFISDHGYETIFYIVLPLLVFLLPWHSSRKVRLLAVAIYGFFICLFKIISTLTSKQVSYRLTEIRDSIPSQQATSIGYLTEEAYPYRIGSKDERVYYFDKLYVDWVYEMIFKEN